MRMFRQSTNQNHLDDINGRSIQTLFRGENDSKQSDEFQAILMPVVKRSNPGCLSRLGHPCNHAGKRMLETKPLTLLLSIGAV